jgi:hypothetical protein
MDIPHLERVGVAQSMIDEGSDLQHIIRSHARGEQGLMAVSKSRISNQQTLIERKREIKRKKKHSNAATTKEENQEKNKAKKTSEPKL